MKTRLPKALIGCGSVLVFVMAILLAAANKPTTDTDLRVQLAQAQSLLTSAQKERAAAQEALAKAEKDRASLILALSKTSSVASGGATLAGQNKSSDIAVNNAVIAQATAVANGIVAEQAAVEARYAANAAAQAASTTHAQNTALMIAQAFGFLAVLTGFLYQAFVASRDRRWAQKDLQKQAEQQAQHQEKLISSIADVKTSADAAYKEANTVNVKIASIGLKMKDDKPLDPQNAPVS